MTGERTIVSPRESDLAAAWRELPTHTSILLACAPADLAPTLRAAERAGFFGMRIEGGAIRAWKGKEGPCYDTGRSAGYRGAAAAAMDDDRHLLFRRIRVCEKTARIYGSPAYREFTEVTEPDPALLARLSTDPVPFDCDTFEADARTLAETVRADAAAAGERRAVLYPGPFRMLILADGTIVRRGRPVRVRPDQARELESRDGAREETVLPAADPENYLELYRARGAACLLDDLAPEGAPGPARAPDLRALADAPEAMRRRLGRMIERGDEYFILSGSDPAQADGCCPSNDVGAANRLAESGILDAWCAAPHAECPTTIYSFAGEMRREGDRPAFTRNEPLRAEVKRFLETGPGPGRRALIHAALWILIAGAIALLVYATLRGGGGR
jgi:hypothetical protein